MNSSIRILAVNPGSTSTRIALFEGTSEQASSELTHLPVDLRCLPNIQDQLPLRLRAIQGFLEAQQVQVASLDAVVGRGGLLHPLPHGTYRINERMLEDLRTGVQGQHASNLGGLLAFELVKDTGKPAFIVDPVVVDELLERVRITGLKGIRRRPISHALSQVASGHRFAAERSSRYDALNLIVAHLGGGISVGAHHHGRCVDVNDALGGEGPFSPQRTGSLPAFPLIDLCYSGRHNRDQVRRMVVGEGGLMNLLGTSDVRVLTQRYLAGESEVVEVLDAMVYAIAKAIAALWPAFDGESVDQIIITGGVARSEPLMAKLLKGLAALPAGITLYPGENEMLALAEGALRVLEGREEAKDYAQRN
ncbi:butyrate kinase [Holophaga foetida]|uniref:butyrate kinase n=1 Tax=Holophaga foetida TaxID=35839 RepID=UPI0002474695|nr:butyrate kinase [Holophaga foetida]